MSTPVKRARLSLDLDLVAMKGIEDVQARTKTKTITDLIRKAVAFYDVVTAHITGGGKIIFKHVDGREEEIKILNP